jgi:multidrug efflux pump
MRASQQHAWRERQLERIVKAMRLEVDQAKARALGVTSQSIAQASKTMSGGTTVGQYREGDKLIDIVLRQPLDERNAITDVAMPTCPQPVASPYRSHRSQSPYLPGSPG